MSTKGISRNQRSSWGRALQGFKPLLAGCMLGLLAAGSASGHADVLAQELRNDARRPDAPFALPGGERRVRLADGGQLVLAADGWTLAQWSSANGNRATRSYRLPTQRRNASVTLLPSGRVLLWGGTDATGQPQRSGLWFDAERKALSAADDLTLSPRAGHTATVLNDGRVLFAGGIEERPAELWDERANRATALQHNALIGRAGHAARLQADGRVRLVAGVNASGRPAATELVFDRERGQFAMAPSEPAAKTGFAGSLPAHGAADVMPDARLSFWFAQEARMDDLNTANVSLVGPGGAAQVRVAPVEGGRLAFVEPVRALFPDSRYTLLIDRVRTQAGAKLPLIAIDFKTAAIDAEGRRLPEAATDNAAGDSARAVTGAGDHAAPCAQSPLAYLPCRKHGELKDAVWTPGQDNTDNRWRIYGPSLEAQSSPRIARIASLYQLTVIRGRVLRIDQQPVADVEVSVGRSIARTDANGWFNLFDVPAGHQELYVDGGTANRGAEQYGQFVVGVQVKPGQLNELPYLMHLPKISERDKIRITSPLRQDLVVGHPDIPGLELHIPKGTVIHDRKGRLVTELAIVPTPVNRAPFPVMENHPMAFTVEPGAAQIRGLSPDANNGIRVYYPNYDGQRPGTEANFWIYDPTEGWRVYGQGFVSADGKHVVPEQGVALHQTMGGMFSIPGLNAAMEFFAPNQSGDCNCVKSAGDPSSAGDPIDLKTGEFLSAETDVAITDIVPLVIGRNYRPHDLQKREFGIGTSWNWGYTLNRPGSNYDVLELVLPNGTSVRFDRIAGTGNQGEWRQVGSDTAFSGAVLKSVFDSDPTQPWGRAFRIVLRDGSRMQFSSWNDIRLRWVEDQHGNRTSLVYSAGLVTKIVSPSGRSVSIDYDTSNRISAIRDHSGRAWGYAYTGDGLLDQVTFPDNKTKRYTYQVSLQSGSVAKHRIESVFDRRGNRVLLNEFEIVNGVSTGRVIRQTQADNGVIEIDYAHSDGTTVGTLVTDPEGHKRRIVFDANSAYPKTETFGYGTPSAQTFAYERNNLGQLIATVDPLQRRTEYQYNALGQTTKVTQLAGTAQARATTLAYRADGDIETITDWLDRVVRYDYVNRCLVRITNTLGKSATFECNAAGQQVKLTDPMNNTTHFEYDGFDLAKMTDALGREAIFRYDELGRRIAIGDGRGNVVGTQYDVMDLAKKTFDAEGRAIEYEFDGNGNALAVLLPNGNGITYTYDKRNRVETRTDGLTQGEVWTYYKTDQVKTYRDRKGQTTSFQYDPIGRKLLTIYHDATQVAATYDGGNRLRTLVDSSAGDLSWDYDLLDQLSSSTTAAGVITYGYDEAGRRSEMTVASQPKIEYRYDDGNRLRRIMQGSDVVTFDYDDGDRIKELVLPNNVKAAYAYNPTNQLTAIAWTKPDQTALGDIGYGYDAVGKLIAQTGSYAPQAMTSPEAGTNTFDDNNRQVERAGQAQSYDANGNMTGDGTRAYIWNVRDQLVRIEQAGTTIASFQYDPMGRRTLRSEQGQSTGYLYDGADAVQEIRAGQVNPILTGPGVDQRFARNEAGGRVYYLTDHLGSTRALTDASGAVVQRYDYTAYGQTSQTASGTSNPYQFTGRERDDSGLYFYRARYYAPDAARFISEDSYGFASGDINFYAYVSGDPISQSDPSGNCPMCVTALIGGVVGAGLNFGLQYYNNGGDMSKIQWQEVGYAGASGMLGGALGVWTAGLGPIASVAANAIGSAAIGGGLAMINNVLYPCSQKDPLANAVKAGVFGGAGAATGIVLGKSVTAARNGIVSAMNRARFDAAPLSFRLGPPAITFVGRSYMTLGPAAGFWFGTFVANQPF
ncbi:Rhs-family protein [Lysobacter capsici AZ78]|uniref:Rhs-family protein n=1 Tax=Lysobacter capsici AZ78 TaxID=1444315 RepID=A0A108UB99_9GAMM|nr:Rhs-family protein [Lysobacter capsici AZ78]